MKVAILISLVIGAFGVPLQDSLKDSRWIDWKLKHKKVYKDAKEETVRYFIWHENVRHIEKHNEGNSSYKRGLNHLSDMVRSMFLNLVSSVHTVRCFQVIRITKFYNIANSEYKMTEICKGLLLDVTIFVS